MATPPFVPVSDSVSVAAQLAPGDLAAVAAAGFRSVINNRPDMEGGASQPSSDQMGRAAEAAGLQYVYLPVDSSNITAENVQRFRELIDSLPGPVLAFCRSGGRCSRLHASAQQLPGARG